MIICICLRKFVEKRARIQTTHNEEKKKKKLEKRQKNIRDPTHTHTHAYALYLQCHVLGKVASQTTRVRGRTVVWSTAFG